MPEDLNLRYRVGPFSMAAKYHYAWVIVAFMSVIQMAGGSIRNIFGVLIVPLEDQYGWEQGDLGAAYAIASVTAAVGSPVVGWIADRYGERKTLVVGVLLFAGGMALIGGVSELWHLYIAYGVLFGGALTVFQLVMVTTAMTWFRRRLGLVIGILMCLNGVGPAIAAPILSLLLNSAGWQATFWIAGMGWSGIMLLSTFFFRTRPSDMGLEPYGALPSDKKSTAPTDARTTQARLAVFRAEVRRTPAFWNLIAIHFLGCVGHVVPLVYVVLMATLSGVETTTAAGIITAISFSSLLSRLAAPLVGDRLGGKLSMGICFLIQGLTVLGLLWASEAWHYYLFGIVFGLGLGGEMSVFPVINRQYYGEAPMGVIYGWQSLGGGAGMALGAWLGGLTFDLTDSYTIAITLSAACSLAGAALILFLEPTRRLLVTPWHEVSAPATTAGAPAAVEGSAD